MKKTLVMACSIFILAACARSEPPAPIDIRGVGTATQPVGDLSASSSSSTENRYGTTLSTASSGESNSGYTPPPGYGASHPSLQQETLSEPNDAYAAAAQGGTSAPLNASAPADSSANVLSSPVNNPATPAQSSTTPSLPIVPPSSSTTVSDFASGDVQGNGQFAWPARGAILSDYGNQKNGQANDGINIAAAQGSPVYAASSGTVSYAGNEVRHLGNVVLVKHSGGFITVYAHLDQIYVSKGAQVLRGQPLGTAGITGGVSDPQVHFEIRKNSTPQNPHSYLGQ